MYKFKNKLQEKDKSRYVFKEKHIKQLDRKAEMKVLVILIVLCLYVGYGNSCTCVGVPTNGCDSDYCKIKFIYLFCNFTYYYMFNWKKKHYTIKGWRCLRSYVCHKWKRQFLKSILSLLKKTFNKTALTDFIYFLYV